MGNRRYNRWAGNEQGTPEDPLRCIVAVHPDGRSPLTYQCQRKRGHGTDGLLCVQHAKKQAAGLHLYIPDAR